MSSKIELSREMAENLLHCGDTASTITPFITAELRALLAAPVVERQLVEEGLLNAFSEYARQFTFKNHPALPAMFPTGYRWFKAGYELGHAAPPELAELQATIANLESKLNRAINLDFERRETIARLTAENERLKGASCGPMAKYPNRLCHIDYTAHPYKCGCLNGDDEAQRIYFEHFKKLETDSQQAQCAYAGHLSLLTEPKGEPVALITVAEIDREYPSPGRNVYVTWLNGSDGALSTGDKLQTSQPAPVSVGYKLVPLTPTPAMVQAGIDTPCGDDEHQDYRDVYASMIGAAP